MTTSEPRAIQPWLVRLRLLVIGLALLVIRDAWRLGFVLLGIGVTLSTSAGRMYFAPGTYTGFWVLAPVVTAAFVELALSPRPLRQPTFVPYHL